MRKPRYGELEDAILAGAFPIIVHGHPGIGKSSAIRDILTRHGIPFRIVDLSTDRVQRPVFARLVLLAQLNSMAELSRIHYRDRLVLESTLPSITHLDGFRLIRFTKNTFPVRRPSSALDALPGAVQGEHVDIFLFLGRLFYRKFLLSDITFSNGLVSVPRKPKPAGIKEPFSPSKCLDKGDASTGGDTPPGSPIRQCGLPTASFPQSKILGYVYENLPEFTDIFGLAECMDCLSLGDSTEIGIAAAHQSVLERAKSPGRRVAFRALPPSTFDILYGRGHHAQADVPKPSLN